MRRLLHLPLFECLQQQIIFSSVKLGTLMTRQVEQAISFAAVSWIGVTVKAACAFLGHLGGENCFVAIEGDARKQASDSVCLGQVEARTGAAFCD